jgi:broad specificity phosphatase PhoE
MCGGYKQMTLFYLIRHGEPYWEINEQYKLKGHGRDLAPLTPNGVKQVYITSKDKRLKEAEIIVSSPYPRALQTAAILSKELQLYRLNHWFSSIREDFAPSPSNLERLLMRR